MSNNFSKLHTNAATLVEKGSLEGNVLSVNAEVVESLLPAELTMETVKQVEEFRTNLGASAVIAAGDVLKAHADQSQIVAHIDLPMGNIQATVDREVQIAGETKNGYAVLSFNAVTEGKDNALAYAVDTVAAMDYSDNLEEE